ncbi:MAG: response regulator transcription factor [Actinobacteria bacterium]|nr:response regulator transcription factor [Actinomycetota bacterium]
MTQAPSTRTVLVVEDDECYRAFLVTALEAGGLPVRAVSTGAAALVAARSEPPALAILDVNLPGLSGYEVCRALREEHGPELPILFLSGERTESFDRVAGLLIGADDYMVKPVAEDELLARVRALVRRSPARAPWSGLTPRELDVLRLLAEGRGQAEIAGELVISPKTVGTHIEHVLAKLGVHSRAEAVAVAYRHDLVGSPV